MPENEIDPKHWEQLCKQCGLCCFEKTRLPNGRIITTRIPCRFLDLHTRQCRVYEHRFEVGEDCQKLTPQLVAEVDWLPEECAYVQWHKQQCAVSSLQQADTAHRKFKRKK